MEENVAIIPFLMHGGILALRFEVDGRVIIVDIVIV